MSILKERLHAEPNFRVQYDKDARIINFSRSILGRKFRAMADVVPNDTFREIRRKRLSRKQLAILLETTVVHIARWESGEAWPPPTMLRKLCAFFQMTPEMLGFPRPDT